MSLAPAVSATLGNLRYDVQAIEASAVLAPLPRGSHARLRLPAGVRFEAAPGDEAKIELDGGEGAHPVLAGRVRRVQRSVDAIEVEFTDAGPLLAAYRPAAAFEKPSAAQVVRALCSGLALTPGTLDLDLDLPAYVAHPARNAAEHIAELARLAGALAVTDGDGKLAVRALPEGPADAALKFGREIVHVSTSSAAAGAAQRLAIGAGPAGSAGAPDALRPTTGVLPASAGNGGKDLIRLPTPVLRTPKAADAASNAYSRLAGARAQRLVAQCFLLPALRPGQVIEVQDLPEGLGTGPWLLTMVEHRVAEGAGSTCLHAISASAPAGLGGLLGAAIAAVGSLL